jgi:hypothetical protein
VLYAAHNAAATIAAVGAGHLADRAGARTVFAAGAGVYIAGYFIFAAGPHAVALLLAGFVLAGTGIGFAETAESTLVAQLLPDRLRASGLACWASPRRRGPRVLGGGRTAVGRAVPGGRLLLRRRVDGRGPGRDSPDPAARPALTTVPRACPEEAGPPGRSQRDSLPRREGPGLELGVWSRGLAFMA